MAIHALGRMRWLPRCLGALGAVAVGGTMLRYSILTVISEPNDPSEHLGLVLHPIPAVFGLAFVVAATLALTGRRSWAPIYWISFASMMFSFVVIGILGLSPLITVAVDGFDRLSFPNVHPTAAEGISMLLNVVALIASGVLMKRFAWATGPSGPSVRKSDGDGMAS